MYQRPTSPLSIGGVLDDGFKLFRVSFTRLFLLALIPAILNQVPSIITTDEGELTVAPVAAIVAFFVMVAGSLIFFGAAIARASAISEGGDCGMGGALGTGSRRALAMLGCVLLFMLAFIGGSILLVIPGLILFVTLLFGNYLVVIDGLGPLEALKQSHRLVWGNWWRTAAALTVIGIIIMVAYGVITFVVAFVAILAGAEEGMVVNIISFVLVPLLSAVVNPIAYTFSIALLNDLKLRKEGGDLAQRMEGLEPA